MEKNISELEKKIMQMESESEEYRNKIVLLEEKIEDIGKEKERECEGNNMELEQTKLRL